MKAELRKHLIKISDTIWEIPSSFKEGMLVPARIYVSEEMLEELDDRVVEQITNVATLPGIQDYAYCMPDAHSGYGFPIGGVAAFDLSTGVISPGGLGFDLNCGMRLIVTNLTKKEVEPKIKELITALFKAVPAGVGGKSSFRISLEELKDIMKQGAAWAIQKGYGWQEDLEVLENRGCIDHADSATVSDTAIKRGIGQLGTLGSGNHYLEVQYAADIFDEKTAKVFGITSQDQIVVMVHCGSRGFGHQIASDYLKLFLDILTKKGISLPDRELAYAPFQSKEGQEYYHAMACAANFAFCNRQIITHQIRKTFESIFNKSAKELEMHTIYDVAHNIGKIEEHTNNGVTKKVLVHRKGSTRAFGPGHEELPAKYKKTGQPVIIGGSMETGSYLLVGTNNSEETYGSTMHGSGRTMSRTQAGKEITGEALQKRMRDKGIYVKAVSMRGLAEEAGSAYKDINEVVDVMHRAGISKKVVQLSPLGNVKG